MDLALNNLQRLICHKTQPTNQSTHKNTLPEHHCQQLKKKKKKEKINKQTKNNPVILNV